MWKLTEDGLAINTSKFDRIDIVVKGSKFLVDIIRDDVDLRYEAMRRCTLYIGDTNQEALDYIKENFNDRK